MNNLNQLLKETTQNALKDYHRQQKQLQKDMEKNARHFLDKYLSKWLLELAQQGKEHMGFILFIDEEDNKVHALDFDSKTIPPSRNKSIPNGCTIFYDENFFFKPEILYKILLKQSFEKVIFNPHKYKINKQAPLWCYSFGISWSINENISFTSNQTKSITSNERNKMTPGLRFNVLKRDNYTCQICGRTAADGVKLHVDHIIPIAKGGKTELNNLQVLCQDCNLGKGIKSM